MHRKIRSVSASLILGSLLAFIALWPALVLRAQAATRLDAVRATFTIAATYANDLDPIDAIIQADFKYGNALTHGTGANQAHVAIYKSDTVAGAATDSYDLAGGLTDAFGNTITCTGLKSVTLWNTDTDTADSLRLVRPVNGVPLFGAAADYMSVGPGGVNIWYTPTAAGVVVTAGTGDLLDVTGETGAGTVSYRIMILCETS